MAGEIVKKFWNKAAESADIFIYGDITTDKWFDTDTTAKSFIEDLNSFEGKHVTVHLNSGGGDVFTGLTISNAIKNYSGGVTVSIDGLAASAASLVAMGGQKITIASNALIMIHNAMVGLFGYYDEENLAKVQNALAAIKGAIIETYSSRLQNVDVEKLLSEETWFSAQEALEAGLVDEITGEVSLSVDDAQHKIFINSLAIDTSKFDAIKMRRAMEVKNNMEPIKERYLASVRQQEISRIRDLQALKCENSAVNALIDTAIENGETVEKIKPYLDAVKNIQPSTANSATEEMKKIICDQLNSGVENVAGGQEPLSEQDKRKMKAKQIADFANAQI